MKEEKPQEYPYASIEMSQADGSFEIAIQIADNIQVSYFIDRHNLKWLTKEIESINQIEKLKALTVHKESTKEAKP